MCNLLYSNNLQTLERDGWFFLTLSVCTGCSWVWCAAAFILCLSGKQHFSLGGGEVRMGKSVEILLGRTCFSEQVAYNHVVHAKFL